MVSEERGRRLIRWEKAGKAEEKGGSRQGVRAERMEGEEQGRRACFMFPCVIFKGKG